MSQNSAVALICWPCTQLAADLVSVFTTTFKDNVCGRGSWPTEWLWDQSDYGTSTVNGCWAGYTLAHEIGHNQGCGHNFDDSAADGGGQGYFYGWRRWAGSYVIIMLFQHCIKP